MYTYIFEILFPLNNVTGEVKEFVVVANTFEEAITKIKEGALNVFEPEEIKNNVEYFERYLHTPSFKI